MKHPAGSKAALHAHYCRDCSHTWLATETHTDCPACDSTHTTTRPSNTTSTGAHPPEVEGR